MERRVDKVENAQTRSHPAFARCIAPCVAAVMLGLSVVAMASGCSAGATQRDPTGNLNVAPTDLTPDAEGNLFVSSASTGTVLRQVDGGWREEPAPGPRPYGLVTTPAGRVCVAH